MQVSQTQGHESILLRAQGQCLRALHGPKPSKGNKQLIIDMKTSFDLMLSVDLCLSVRGSELPAVAPGQRLQSLLRVLPARPRGRPVCQAYVLP